MKVLMQAFLMSYATVLAVLPRFVFISYGVLLGRLLAVTSFRRNIMQENLQRAFPEMSQLELDVLIDKNYRHYGILFLEFVRSFAFYGKYLEEYAEVEGEEHLHKALAQGKGLFVATAHLGNWELLSAFGSHVLKVPTTMVTKELKPAWLHTIVEESRSKVGTQMAFEPQTLKVVMKALRRKEVVGFAIDQFAGAPVGVRVPFFNIPVGTHTALATLSVRTGAPVIPGIAIRKPDNSYVIKFGPQFPQEKIEDLDPNYASTQEEEIVRNTAAYSKWVEERVREYPEQWLWIHRRWKGDLSPLPSKVLGEMLK